MDDFFSPSTRFESVDDDFDEEAVEPVFESTVGDDDQELPPFATQTRQEPEYTGPAWLPKLPFVGLGLAVVGIGVAFVPAVHGLGFWVASLGVLASASGFLPPRKSLKLTAIAVFVSIVAAFATGLVPHGGMTDASPTAPVPAGGPNTVTFTIDGAGKHTEGAVQFTVDRTDGTTTAGAAGVDLPWTKSVGVDGKQGDPQDAYTVRVTPKDKKSGGLACWITVGDTIVTTGLAQPGQPLVCRFIGTTSNPVAVSTIQDARNLVKSLKPHTPAG